jgi:hypothetical protein
MNGIPASQNTAIQQGQVATLANFADTTTFNGVRGGLVTAAGLPNTFFRLNPQVQDANIGDNLSVSTWHAMKVELGKRFSEGTYFQMNYTLSKGLTDYVGGQSVYDDFRDNLNRRLDKTIQDFDSTHVVQANGIWELPVGTNKRFLNGTSGWMNAVLGGWQVNGILQVATSRPFSVFSGWNTLTVGEGSNGSTANFSGTDFNLMANVIKGDQITTITAADKAKYFSAPAAGSPGGTPQRAFRGPLYTNIDASVLKGFKVPVFGEQGGVQFRFEAFNILNHANFDLPPTANRLISAGSFGALNTTFAARILQFALKLTF